MGKWTDRKQRWKEHSINKQRKIHQGSGKVKQHRYLVSCMDRLIAMWE